MKVTVVSCCSLSQHYKFARKVAEKLAGNEVLVVERDCDIAGDSELVVYVCDDMRDFARRYANRNPQARVLVLTVEKDLVLSGLVQGRVNVLPLNWML